MRSKFWLFLLLIFPILSFGQINRSVLQGRIVTDSLDVENITVKNTTAGLVSATDSKGKFRILVKEKDTLVFSSVSFQSSYLVVNQTHLEDEDLKVRLEVKINALDEIIVRPYTLTGNLETDSKTLKVKIIDLNLPAAGGFSVSDIKYNPVDNALKNAMGTPGNDFNGIDFAKLGGVLLKAIFKPKPKPKKIEFISNKTFVDAAKEKYSENFFTQTLKLKPEEIELFLSYCEQQHPNIRQLLNPKKEFEFTDFLIKKSEEYLKNNRY
ncbi:carboxypeptidase-like regulatory domain-containing protein [Flavobacterium sp.]|uniref:carboxypeptidase-like regulatory domain-containing protein n=1 Tax=Flavobacterium sp. TaxID=239 RepID=UPI0028BEA2F4|nr:carboxypeptidase-like regulatory domain-containing protein [Flavobacterium sp.]